MAEKEEKALDDFYDPDVQPSLEAPKDGKPVVLREVLEEMELVGPHIKAEDLKGQTFSIYKATPFKSMAKKGGNAYYCHCTDLEKSEIFTTTLGGQAVVELLELYFVHGPGAPFIVTLNWNEGGEYGGYWTID